MFLSSEVKSNISRISSVFDKHDESIKQNNEHTIKILSAIDNIASNLDGHIQKEDKVMKDQAGLLKAVNDKLDNIEIELATQPKDFDLKLVNQQDFICNKVSEKFASKEELNQATKAIRREAKLLAGALSTILIILGMSQQAGVFNGGS